jgi:hypothetical protein
VLGDAQETAQLNDAALVGGLFSLYQPQKHKYAFLGLLEGSYALALYDSEADTALGARDASGRYTLSQVRPHPPHPHPIPPSNARESESASESGVLAADCPKRGPGLSTPSSTVSVEPHAHPMDWALARLLGSPGSAASDSNIREMQRDAGLMVQGGTANVHWQHCMCTSTAHARYTLETR